MCRQLAVAVHAAHEKRDTACFPWQQYWLPGSCSACVCMCVGGCVGTAAGAVYVQRKGWYALLSAWFVSHEGMSAVFAW
jgi:hypothetical protein